MSDILIESNDITSLDSESGEIISIDNTKLKKILNSIESKLNELNKTSKINLMYFTLGIIYSLIFILIFGVLN